MSIFEAQSNPQQTMPAFHRSPHSGPGVPPTSSGTLFNLSCRHSTNPILLRMSPIPHVLCPRSNKYTIKPTLVHPAIPPLTEFFSQLLDTLMNTLLPFLDPKDFILYARRYQATYRESGLATNLKNWQKGLSPSSGIMVAIEIFLKSAHFPATC